ESASVEDVDDERKFGYGSGAYRVRIYDFQTPSQRSSEAINQWVDDWGSDDTGSDSGNSQAATLGSLETHELEERKRRQKDYETRRRIREKEKEIKKRERELEKKLGRSRDIDRKPGQEENNADSDDSEAAISEDLETPKARKSDTKRSRVPSRNSTGNP